MHSNVCCPTDQLPQLASGVSIRSTTNVLPGPVVTLKVGVLTVSDRVSGNIYEDLSGPEVWTAQCSTFLPTETVAC